MSATAADQPFFFSTSTMSGAENTPFVAGQGIASKAPSGEDLVQRARREISEIVREVAALSRQSLDQASFFAALIDRMVCAIAAEGAVLWDCRSGQPEVITRTGRATDLSIKSPHIAPHLRLLQEIADHQSPVVVPSTPEASDPKVPANPTAFPVAVVPIVDLAIPERSDTQHLQSTGPRYVLEVFLEAEAGVATQRGYLRFIVQMADLASEFLRNDEIRRARSSTELQNRAMASLTQMHALGSSAAVAAKLVDDAATMMKASRVTLASIHVGRAKLLAISHVPTLDARGAACQQLSRAIAAFRLPPQERVRFHWEPHDEDVLDSRGSFTDLPLDAPMMPAALIANDDDSLRLLLQDAAPRSRDEQTLTVFEHWTKQAFAIYESRRRFESIPLAKAYFALTPALLSVSPSKGRRIVTLLAAALVFAVLVWIPTPMIVSVPATLRPAGIQTHYAPSDVIIETIAVSHRQTVKSGDVLMQLRDWNLDEQITTLTARRGVITQRLARSLASLVEAPGKSTFSRGEHESSSDEELVQQHRLLEEELAGINEQLELLNASRDRLVIRAQCDGIVDAWQAEMTAQGRPVRRGDALIRVEPNDAPWMVDARIPQSRLSVVMDHLRASPDGIVSVATISQPDQTHKATFVRRQEVIAPSSAEASQNVVAAEGMLGVELQLHVSSADNVLLSRDDWACGTPAIATIDCGRMPLAQVMFFDLLRAARRTLSRWI